MSAILPMVTRASGRRRGVRRPAAPPRGGCAAPRRFRRGLQDVGDLAHGDRAGGTSPRRSKTGSLLALDAQRLVGFAAGLQDVGDLAHGDRARADVAEAFVDRQLLLLADAQRLVGFAAGLQDVGDLAHGDARARTSPRRS